jgi:hypothetical protein
MKRQEEFRKNDPEFFFFTGSFELKKLSPQSYAETGDKQDAEKNDANQPFIF